MTFPSDTGSRCSYCGVRIVWSTTPEGTNIPLDPRAPVYEFDPLQGTAVLIPQSSGYRTHMVSHFATCSKVTRKGQERLALGPGGQPERRPKP